MADKLITLSQYKEYAGITGTDQDDFLTELIERATSAIQKFTDRDFVETTYREIRDWDYQVDLLVHQYPIVSVSLLSESRDDAFGIKNTSGDAYSATVTVNDTSMVLVVQGGVNAGTNSLTLSSYSTLTDLQTAITALDAGWEMTSLTDDIAKWSASELLPVSGLYCLSDYTNVQIPAQPESEFVIDYEAGIVSGSSNSITSGRARQNLVIKYTAGYATIPGDLQQICIDLTKVYDDAKDSSSNLEQERIGDYSYKIGDIESGNMPVSIQNRLSGWMRRTL